VRTRENLIIFVCAIVIVALMVGRGLGPEMVLLDRFHTGDYFANTMVYIGNGVTEQRGLMDILPSLLTSSIWDSTRTSSQPMR
jgi:hypothetical protein